MHYPNYMGLPEDLVAGLDPVRVRDYVQATGWVRLPALDDGKVAVFVDPDAELDQLLVPLRRDLGDFNPRMAEVVAYIAQREKRPALEVLYELLLPPADLLCFRESGPAVGPIDLLFDHGVQLLAGVRKMLLAAACSVIRPEPLHPRSNLPEAEQFLQRCRLAQASQGGFAVTVACPLDAGPGTPKRFEEPFSRRVTALLLRSLDRLARAFEAGDPNLALVGAENEPVISANLCEGLLEMTPEGEGSSLTVTAGWARSLPPPAGESLPGSVRLRREDFARLESLVRQLQPAHQPQRQALLGVVETLNGRRNAGGQVEGEVVLTILDPEGETLRARADLKAASYAAAAEAHLRALPVSLQGVLHRGVRAHRIEDVTEFMVYPRLAQHPESA
jgi:hypothetical protein